MKHKFLLFIISISAVLACTSIFDKPSVESELNFPPKIAGREFLIQTDSIIIYEGFPFSFKLGQIEYNSIIKNHPEFFSKEPLPPYYAYQLYCCDSNDIYFSSMIGYGFYQTVYCHFFALQNNHDSLIKERLELYEIFTLINDLHYPFIQGNPHLEDNILYHLEKSVSQESKAMDQYDIEKQRIAFVSFLKQWSADEWNINYPVIGNPHDNEDDLTDRMFESNEKIDQIDSLLTSKLHLKCAQKYFSSLY